MWAGTRGEPAGPNAESPELFPEQVLHFAYLFLDLPLGLFGRPAILQTAIADRLAGDLLGFSGHLFGRALDLVIDA